MKTMFDTYKYVAATLILCALLALCFGLAYRAGEKGDNETANFYIVMFSLCWGGIIAVSIHTCPADSISETIEDIAYPPETVSGIKPAPVEWKTAEEWYNTFPEPYRTQALQARKDQNRNTALIAHASAEAALKDGFIWMRTGSILKLDEAKAYLYWRDFHETL